MNLTRRSLIFGLGTAIAGALPSPALATTHDGRSYAIDAAIPELERKHHPFRLRQKWWHGELLSGKHTLLKHQLYKRNEYWFWAGLTDDASSKVSIHIYDSEGILVESESWQRGHVAGARILTPKTGMYYIMVKVTHAPAGELAEWAVIYGYR